MTEPINMIDPYQVLQINPKDASDKMVHQAYLEMVKQFPPDKNPEHFQRIRDAYEMIKSQEDRTKINLFGIEDTYSLADILPDGAKRLRVGADKWFSMIETEAKRMKDKTG